MILGLNPHSFVNLPAEEQEKLLKEYGSQKAAEKALEEKYGEMARHPIVKMSKSLATSSTRRGGGSVRCRHHASVRDVHGRF